MMLVDVNHIFKAYGQGKNRFQSLNDITFGVEKSELVVILGASGSGKSTLLNVIGSVDRIDSGSITVDNKQLEKLSSSELVAYRRNVVGFIFQMYQLVPNLTVYENIELAANISIDSFSIQEMIEAVGLSGLEKRFPRELSGGQQQRVSIARAIVKKPQLLLCDEPTGALDSKTSKDILSLIRTINQKYGMTVLLVTHNAAISRMADRTLTIKDGALSSDVKNRNVQTVEGIEL